uniref:ABC transporter permease n=1 Tax=Prevotella sp. TaxID=59823 RepID=UPI003FEF1B7E
MNKILIIIQREFLKRVRTKGFIILTITMPFIMAALVFVPLWLSSIENDEQQKVAVIDPTGVYAKALKASKSFAFSAQPVITEEMRSEDSPYDAVVAISGDLVKNNGKVTIYSHKEIPGNLLDYIQSKLNETVQKQKLEATGIAGLDKIIDDVQRDVNMKTVKWSKEGDEQASSTYVAIIVGGIFTLLIYIFVITYGGMVMQSVIEEKTNRIMELLVSSVKPFQLMMGKIIGVMLVGIAQMALWGVMLSIIMTVASVGFGVSQAQSIAAGQPMPSPTMNMSQDTQELLTAIVNLPYAEIGLMFIIMFVGGYLLYSSFFAATGASINEQEDANQFVVPITMITLFGLYAAMYSIENTDGPLAFWASLFPLTSPIVMMIRIPFGVPLWQELLSIALLYASAFLMIWIGGKIYRVGILMYGKKPSIKEIIKWMRYK